MAFKFKLYVKTLKELKLFELKIDYIIVSFDMTKVVLLYNQGSVVGYKYAGINWLI